MNKIELIDRAAVIADLKTQFAAVYKDTMLRPIMDDDPFIEVLAKSEGQHMQLFLDGLEEYLNMRPAIDAAPVRRGECEYCGGSQRVLYQETHIAKLFLNTFGNARTIEVEANRCPPFADCPVVNVPARSAFIINFCPNCGADMRKVSE